MATHLLRDTGKLGDVWVKPGEPGFSLGSDAYTPGGEGVELEGVEFLP